MEYCGTGSRFKGVFCPENKLGTLPWTPRRGRVKGGDDKILLGVLVFVTNKIGLKDKTLCQESGTLKRKNTSFPWGDCCEVEVS